jgi:N-acetylneuraminic acid mutarotase
MKKIIFILNFIPILLVSQSWVQHSIFPFQGVHHPITFSYGQFGFVVAGSNTDHVYKYDENNGNWSQLSDFPGGERGYAYGVAVGDKAYIGFGSDLNGMYPIDWWEYNMISDIWTQKANFPNIGRNHPAMVNVGDKIFIGCGSNNTGNLGDWWEYDIPNDVWQQKIDLPANDRHHPFYFGIGNYAYVGFGHGSVIGPGSNPNSNSNIYNDFYRYDPSNDSWLQLSDFPSESRVAGTQFSYNGKGYILSGDGDNHGPLDSGEFWEYETSNDSWLQLNSHPGDAIWAPGNFVIDCNVYFLLGQNNNTAPSTYVGNIYQYKLSSDCGCTDSIAENYSPIAIIDDGSCCFFSGCTDPLAINYDSIACFDNGSCIAPVLGCTNQTASNFDPNANTDLTFGGALDNTFGSGGYFNGDQHLNFDAFKECVIKSAMIYSEGSNTITFELRDNNSNVIDDTTLNLVAGQQTIPLNFNVPIANDLQLGVSPGALTNLGLYRNNSNSNFPYNIASAINITGSSAGTNPLSYYYFFYDIELIIPCLDFTNEINEVISTSKLIKITDVLGREKKQKNKTNQPLLYIYDDGTVEKKIIFK